MDAGWIVSIALGLGLSASAGFRVFVPLLVAAVAARFNILPLNESFAWLASWPAIICFGAACVFEILAYYIPFFDNLLDAINTPLAITAGTLLATSVMPGDQAWIKWVSGIIIGGGGAGIIHAGTSLLRLLSSKTTAGIGNSVVSTGEHIAAFSTSISVLFMPLIVGAIVLLLILFILSKLPVFRSKKE